ncbi:MAG: hypothetical protein IT499_03395 [Rubrivivax sp.]|nr:hypothetical protein [Rubrivivax sp.]
MNRALRAACYARHGSFEEAESEIASLRAQFGDGRNGRVTITIMCAEAQLIYFKDLGDQARDRMMRAQLLSVAGRDAALSALTSAWLAHICFNLHRHEEMVRSAKTALDMISSGDHEAASRLALTFGDAFYAADQLEIGNRWYSKARERAVKLGDHSTIAALTYNRAAMGTFCHRLHAVHSPVEPDVLRRSANEVRTAINYQAIAQLTSLQALLDYSMASVQMLLSNYADAINLLAPMAASLSSTSPLNRAAALRCDLAYCYAKSGDLVRAKEHLDSIANEDVTKLMPDDQVVSLAALASAAEACGLAERSMSAKDALAVAEAEHQAAVSALRDNLKPFSDSTAINRL